MHAETTTTFLTIDITVKPPCQEDRRIQLGQHHQEIFAVEHRPPIVSQADKSVRVLILGLVFLGTIFRRPKLQVLQQTIDLLPLVDQEYQLICNSVLHGSYRELKCSAWLDIISKRRNWIARKSPSGSGCKVCVNVRTLRRDLFEKGWKRERESGVTDSAEKSRLKSVEDAADM